MTDLERQILNDFENEQDVVAKYGEFFMDLCRDAAKYIHSEDDPVREYNKREEIASEIYDWLYDATEYEERLFDPEELAKDYKAYWEM